MNFNKNGLYANLGWGNFTVDKLHTASEGICSELVLLEGGADRRLTGSRRKITLEGRYDVFNDTGYFRQMIGDIRTSGVTNAVICGETIPKLYLVRSVFTVSDDSNIGRYVITLAEL
ncbi:MAG: hypothetical protein IKO27_06625 [Ruminococcus sp.]|nr:hypothetical protein [Ruminococcus sp.]